MLEELLIKIKATSDLGGFDRLSQKLRSAESVSKSSSSNIRNNLNQLNNTRFDGLGNKFKSVIHGMASTAKAGAKSIADTLTSMTSSVEGALAGIAGAYGVGELFEKGMSKALTTTQLKNVKPGEYNSIMSQYLKFTEKSSASDEDINKMLRFTYGGPGGMTYQALNALDAASYSADKLQRMEGIRGWGTYLTGGWSAASGMMRDEPLTADQKKLLQSANTYEERVAALEAIGKQKGNIDKFGNSLSTTVDGPLGKYNKSLAAQDAIIRGATSSFDSLMAAIEPAITWFTNLDQGTKDVVGLFLTLAAVGTTLAMGLGLVIQLISPVIGVFSKIKDWVGNRVTNRMDVKAAVVNIKDKLTGGTGGGNSRLSKLMTISELAIAATIVYLVGGEVRDKTENWVGGTFNSWGGPWKTFNQKGGTAQLMNTADIFGMYGPGPWTEYPKMLKNAKTSFNLTNDDIFKNLFPSPSTVSSWMYNLIMGINFPILKWPSLNGMVDIAKKMVTTKIPKLNWPSLSGLPSYIQGRVSAILNQWKYKLLNIVPVSGLGLGSAGAPGLTDDLYGVGSYFEPVNMSAADSSSTVINKTPVTMYIGSVDSTERVNEITKALSALNDSKGR